MEFSLKIPSATLLIILASTSSVYADDFAQSWSTLLNNDAKLAAKSSAVDHAQQLNEASKKLRMPKVDITAGAIRMQKPISLDADDLEPIASLPEGALPTTGLDLPTVTDFTNQDVVSATARAEMPIYAGGSISSAQDFTKAGAEASNAEFELTKDDQFNSLIQRYFGTVLADQVVIVYSGAVDGLKLHLHNAQALEKHGQIARVERMQAQVALDQMKIKYDEAVNKANIAHLSLDSIVGKKVADLNTPLFCRVQLEPKENYIAQTISNHPGISLVDAKKEQAEAGIQYAKSAYKPKVFAFGDYQLYEDNSLASDINPDWTIGIGVSIPLASNTGRSNKLKAAHALVDQASATQRSIREDLTLLVNKTYAQALQAQQVYQNLSSSVEMAKENLTLRRDAFDEGLGASSDVVDAENYLASVLAKRSVAQYKFIVNYGNLEALRGQKNQFINSTLTHSVGSNYAK